MEKFTFENQGTNTYLVYAITAEDAIDTMSLGMLTNNKIAGLAPAIFTQMDANKFIKYNVSAHISVKQFFSGPVNKKRLLGVFNGIVDAMLSAEEYMIDTNAILLDLDYIFADVSTCETVLICLPLMDGVNSSTDLGLFFKNIMFSTQFDQTENCDHIAKIMNYLNSTPLFSLVDFKNLLNDLAIGAQVQQPVVAQPVAPAPVQPPVASAPKAEPAKPVAPAPVQPQAVSSAPKASVAPQAQAVSVNVPPMQTPPAQKNASAVPATGEQESEKKISMLDLLMHYNKDNAAKYKAQKEASKNATAVPAPAPAVKAGFAVPGQATPAPANKGFAVPGQATPAPVNKGFAVPGQAAPAPANKGFAIPGQAAPAPAPAPAPVSKPEVAPQKTQPVAPAVSTAPPIPVAQPTHQPPVTPQGRAMNFGETTVLGGGNIGETTVLGAAPTAAQPMPHLMRSKNNEKISLNKPVFRIGKEKSYVDYFIGDNTAISRSHANFIIREGKYFVVDTNSTNHTYVNGAMIQSNVETQLSHGDKVRLANEDFEFKLY